MTLTTDQTHTRQLGFFNPADHPHAHVTFVGVGGIGSFAAFAAAKLGIPKITLIDPDVVEPHNQPSQMYSAHDVGDTKVEALLSQILGTVEPIPDMDWHATKLEDVPLTPGVVVSGLDSMEARSNLWEKLAMEPTISLYLDGRLDGEKMMLYALKPWDLDDIEGYEKTLYSDEDAEQGVCTMRNIIDVGFMFGALITRALRLHFADEPIDNVTYVHEGKLTIMKGEWLP